MLCPVINIHGFITVPALYSEDLIYADESSLWKKMGRGEKDYVHFFTSRTLKNIYHSKIIWIILGWIVRGAERS